MVTVGIPVPLATLEKYKCADNWNRQNVEPMPEPEFFFLFHFEDTTLVSLPRVLNE